VVRCLLVPALVALFGKANWWLPSPLARVLRVPADPAVPAGPAGPAVPADPAVELASAHAKEMEVSGVR